MAFKPQNITPVERSQAQKDTIMIPFIGNIQNRRIYKDRKQTAGVKYMRVTASWTQVFLLG